MASQRRAGQHRKPKPRNLAVARGTVTVVTAAAAMTGVIGFAGSANAAPAGNFEQVKAQVDQLNHDVVTIGEEANGLEERTQQLQETSNQTQTRVAEKQSAMNELRDQIGQVAAAQYRSGGMPTGLQLAMSEDPTGFLAKAQIQGQLDGQQADKLRQIASQARMLQQDKAEAGRQLTELEGLRKDLGARRASVQTKLAEAKKLLNTLSAAEQERINNENDHLKEKEDRSSRGNERETPKEEEVEPPIKDVPASGKAGAALNAAMSQIGKPYQSGEEGPNAYDCSGLMQWAYKQVNISLPRVTYGQYKVGRSVSKAELQPGDMVFFTNLSHVGMYIGNGNVVHAPKPGAKVRVEKMSNMTWYGARRVA